MQEEDGITETTEPRETLTVIVPCRNEQDSVALCVDEILGVAPRLDVDVDILLIDDGSTDDTHAVMTKLAETHANVRIQRNPQNLGLGRSVLIAYSGIDPDHWVTVIPGDHELCFDSIEEFLTMRSRFDIILGYYRNPVIRPFRRRMASIAYRRVVNAVFGFPHRYLNGLKLYRARSVQGIEVLSSGHAYVPELLAKAILRNPQLKVGEAPFDIRGRATGRSHAIRPAAVLQAIKDVAYSAKSVSRYREQIVSARGQLARPDE